MCDAETAFLNRIRQLGLMKLIKLDVLDKVLLFLILYL